MPGNSPILFSRILGGFGQGVPKLDFGIMIQWSNAVIRPAFSIHIKN